MRPPARPRCRPRLWLRLEGNRILWRAARPPSPALLAELRANREVVATVLAAEEAERSRNTFEERAAIMEFDGGMSRCEPEGAARTDVSALGAAPVAAFKDEKGGR